MIFTRGGAEIHSACNSLLSLGLPLSLVAQGVDAARKRVVPELGSSQSSQYPDQGLEFGADGLQGVRDAPEALL